jgi:hypothetical protein
MTGLSALLPVAGDAGAVCFVVGGRPLASCIGV